MRDARELQTGF